MEPELEFDNGTLAKLAQNQRWDQRHQPAGLRAMNFYTIEVSFRPPSSPIGFNARACGFSGPVFLYKLALVLFHFGPLL